MSIFSGSSNEIQSYGPRGPWFVQFDPVPVQPLFLRFAKCQHCLLLDSATTQQAVGRYSFLTHDPVHWSAKRSSDPADWRTFQQMVSGFEIDWPPTAPPFCGGVAGLLSYDWCRAFERIEEPQRDDFQVPNLALGIYDYVIAWDHTENKCWLIASGFPQSELGQRKQNAIAKIQELQTIIESVISQPASNPDDDGEFSYHGRQQNANHRLHSIAIDQNAYRPLETQTPDKSLDQPFDLTNRLLTASPVQQYRSAIDQALGYLNAGDIFQVNLAQQLVMEIHESAPDFYVRLRQSNPAPMMGFLDLHSHQIVSASPERLVSSRGPNVETRPIKGTCPRTGDSKTDRILGQQLQASEKNCAENLMIVDLLRNDLSRVCTDESVIAEQLCELETFEFVQHLTSCITGTLQSDKTAWDIIPAIFPGGSITGAPKVRAMEIINQLEPVARGAYCGSLGYISFADREGHTNSDWSILIRTATVMDNWCQIPVGGGIVLDSDADLEFNETLEKAKGMLAAVGPKSRVDSARTQSGTTTKPGAQR